MPLKHPDPFRTNANLLDAAVNPYVAALREGAEHGVLPVAFGPQLVNLPGGWREHLQAHYLRPESFKHLVVEIGCHLGRTLLQMARQHPDVAFIGIDITYKRVVTTAKRAKVQGLTNVFGVLANAAAIDRLFAPGELDGCIIFFPDPWVKKARQAKNRLVNASFSSKLAGSLAPGGFCWLKTDQKLYFDAAAEAFGSVGLEVMAGESGLITGDFTSTFEGRFQDQGLPTYSGKWRKRQVPEVLFA